MIAPVVYPKTLTDRLTDVAPAAVVYLTDQVMMKEPGRSGDPWLVLHARLHRHVALVNLRTGVMDVLPGDTACAVVEVTADVVGDDW